MTHLIRVTLPHAVFGLVVRGGVVVEAAPIARWSLGMRGRNVVSYYRARGGVVEIVSETV